MRNPMMSSSSEARQMSIRPIDIQTMLMQMSQVGKDQALEKDGAVLQADIKAAEEQKRQNNAKEAIRAAAAAEADTSPIRDRKEGGAAPQSGKGSRNSEEKEDQPEETEEVVRDPHLGNRLDISG